MDDNRVNINLEAQPAETVEAQPAETVDAQPVFQAADNGAFQQAPPQMPADDGAFQQAPPQMPPVNTADAEAKKWSTIALVLGLVGMFGGWIPVIKYVTFICAILAIVFGVKARKLCTACGRPRGAATAGFVLGIVAIAITIIVAIMSAIAVAALGVSGLEEFM